MRNATRIGRGPVRLVGHRWKSRPVEIATGPFRRWKGLRPRPRGRGLVLRTRSVTARGMAEALGFAIVDDLGLVRRTGTLMPGRSAGSIGPCWFVELPATDPLPEVASRLSLVRP